MLPPSNTPATHPTHTHNATPLSTINTQPPHIVLLYCPITWPRSSWPPPSTNNTRNHYQSLITIYPTHIYIRTHVAS